jgi:hypothetical protein
VVFGKGEKYLKALVKYHNGTRIAALRTSYLRELSIKHLLQVFRPASGWQLPSNYLT